MEPFIVRSRLLACVLPLASLLAASACSPSSAPPGGDAKDRGQESLGGTVYLRTSESGLYVSAELGGGGAIRANRALAGPWESFDLLDQDGAPLRSGDHVELRTSNGQNYVSADKGGGAGVTASATSPGPFETWTVVALDGGDEIGPGARVALQAASGHYLVAEGGGGGVVNANRNSVGPWETFLLLDSPPSGAGDVLPADTTLAPPTPSGAVLATVTGYEMSSPCPFADSSHCQLPLYASYDRDKPEFWDVLVEELVHSRVNIVLAHGRGCIDPNQGDSGNGNMCPRLLRHMVEAIDRAGVRGVIRLGMWDDTGAYPGTRNIVESRPPDTPFDLADTSSWRFFWDHNMRVWFDTVPSDLWYRMNGRPVVAFWSLADAFFTNQNGNARALLQWLRDHFKERYGEDPLFDVDVTWIQEDPTITSDVAQGVNEWFGPPGNNFTLRSWGGASWGAMVPGFRDPDNSPGCGAPCREVPRNDGDTLRKALTATAGAKLVLLEGWTDIAESAGYYRSNAWTRPNQYIDVVREFADAETRTIRFEAEAADAYSDTTPGNAGGQYRDGDLDIARLQEPAGWYVGWTEPGEWLEYRDVALSCGTYRFTARANASAAGRHLRFSVDGEDQGSVEVPAGAFGLVHLGTKKIDAGRHTLRVSFDDAGIGLDWFFARKATGCN